MLYKTSNGLKVCSEGWVIIEGVAHFIRAGYVVCDNGLNSRSWNTTEQTSTCEKCKAKFTPKAEQQNLF